MVNMADSPPVPDPTILTTEQLMRQVTAERDYVDGRIATLEQRLHDMDVATQLLNETVNRTPTQIQTEIQHVRELQDEQFKGIRQQFSERDTRSERESRDNKVAVDAAFAAQKEAAAKQDESNAKAIDKSEKATTETISKLNELFQSSNKALSEKIDDLKERVGKIESRKEGGELVRHQQQITVGQILAMSSIAVGILTVLVYIAAHGLK